MKKILAVVLAMVCVFGITACGGKSASKKTANDVGGKWPARGIKIIVPWAAGGGSDLAVRTLTPYLEKDLGVKITVVNMKGANGWVAWNELVKAPKDGYTIAQMNIPTVTTGYLDPKQKRKENFNSFTFLANEISDWGCMVVSAKDTRFKDLKGFLEYAKINETLAADNGVGTNKHLLAVELNKKLNLKLKYVHQAGWSETYSALLGGHMDVGWGSIGEVSQAVKDGELKILAVFAPKRVNMFPDTPTFNELMKEQKVEILSPSDRGFAGPAGMDPKVVARLDQAFKNCITNKEFVEKMTKFGQGVNYMNSKEYTEYVKKNEEQMKEFFKGNSI